MIILKNYNFFDFYTNMKRFSFKLFIKIFFILLVLEFVILMFYNIAFQSDSMMLNKLSIILGFFSFVFSLPLKLVNPSYPFYATGEYKAIVLTIVNLVIQTFIIIFILNTFKKK